MQIRALLLISFLLNIGCATMSFDDHQQKVLIRSLPSGAKISYEGKEYGKTPSYLDIEKGRSDKKARLTWPNGASKDLKIKSNYDWQDSFFANFVFLTLAPIGWAVDYFTGYGFKYEKPAKVIKPGIRRKVRAIAIAPPLTPDESLSDHLGPEIVDALAQNYPDSHRIPYDVTLPLFVDSGQDFNLDLSREDKNRLAFVLKGDFDVTHVFYSSAKLNGGDVRIEGELVDTETGETLERKSLNLTDKDVQLLADRRWTRKLGRFVSVIPNSVSLDFGNASPELKYNQETYSGRQLSQDGWLGSAGKVLESFSIYSSPAPTKRSDWRFSFKFIPGLNVNYGDIGFEESPELKDNVYTRFRGMLGYGPQIGYTSRYGIVTASFLVGAGYTDIEWSGPNGTGSYNTWGFQTLTEIAYTFFINESLHFKLHNKRIVEDSNAWANAVGESSNLNLYFIESSDRWTGLSVGYYFQSEKSPARKIIR